MEIPAVHGWNATHARHHSAGLDASTRLVLLVCSAATQTVRITEAPKRSFSEFTSDWRHSRGFAILLCCSATLPSYLTVLVRLHSLVEVNL